MLVGNDVINITYLDVYLDANLERLFYIISIFSILVNYCKFMSCYIADFKRLHINEIAKY